MSSAELYDFNSFKAAQKAIKACSNDNYQVVTIDYLQGLLAKAVLGADDLMVLEQRLGYVESPEEKLLERLNNRIVELQEHATWVEAISEEAIRESNLLSCQKALLMAELMIAMMDKLQVPVYF